MNILAIDRSTDTQSVALALDGKVYAKVFAGLDSRASDWPVKIRDFLAMYGKTVRDLDQVLVGQGPGSFAGIRAALAFAATRPARSWACPAPTRSRATVRTQS